MKPKKTIQTLEAYAVPLFDEDGYIKLDANENNFGPSPSVIEALRNLEPKDVQYYPFYGTLLEKLAEFHSVSMENIILTNGADEAISAILDTFLESGQTVLTVAPTFVMPKIYSRIGGLNFKEIPYEDKWLFPEDKFISQITSDVDLVYLTTPNSPTGEVIKREVIEKIVEKSGEKAVLIDETYGNYAGITNLDLLKDKDNLFIVRSFSKDFALAGLRLGYIISAPENIKYLRKYLAPYNVSTVSVKAGIAALGDLQYFEKIKIETEKSKEIISDAMKKLSAYVYDSKTNFLCADFGKKADFIYNSLLKNKIKVKYFKNAPMLENSFRIGVPTLENGKKFLEAIKIKPAIVFDMDGVLIDASKSYRVAVQKTFKHFSGQEVSLEQISEAKKLGGLNNDWDLTEFLLKKQGITVDKDNLVEIFQEFYSELADIEEPLVTKDFLEKLSENYNLAVFTGRLKAEAEFTLKKHGFDKYFYPTIVLEDVGLERQKPDSLGLELVKEKIIADKIYYIGDTVDDMICASSAQVVPIGVLPPQDKSENLKELLKSKNAVVVLNQISELSEFLEREYAKN